ncbi:LCP family glycopolymer transferase [Brevibacillus daliensis]|uniref:LCP family glycopolymer transferase n=1 Tax=Brevibacillus daliensis TaxID=2892995 RepID=UPI001E44D1D1|nr:LCP family protein [Brevibacillus daliensis]
MWNTNKVLEQITQPNRDDNLLVKDDGIYQSDKPVSLVILGRDTRNKNGMQNTDVMLVAVINPMNKKVTMLSIPRDTRTKIEGFNGYHKANSIYYYGELERRQTESKGQKADMNGIKLVKKTLEEILGIPIQYSVQVDFQGFTSVIDAIGGVEINIDRELKYNDPTDGTHIDLMPGLQLLNGDQTLGYVRHRKDNRGELYYSSDFDRNRRQQEVIKAIMNKISTFDGMTKIPKIVEVSSTYVSTDLTKDQIMGLVFNFKNINSSAITILENGAYWQTKFTYLPKEQLTSIRERLQNEMGIARNTTTNLNDSPILLPEEAKSVETRSKTKQKPMKSVQSNQPTPKTTKQTETKQPNTYQQPDPSIEPPAENPSENPSDTEIILPHDNTPLNEEPVDLIEPPVDSGVENGPST